MVKKKQRRIQDIYIPLRFSSYGGYWGFRALTDAFLHQSVWDGRDWVFNGRYDMGEKLVCKELTVW